MSMIFAFMLAAGQPTAAAQRAPDWRPIGHNRERNIYYDAAGVERGPEVVTVRIRTEAVRAPEASMRTLSRIEIRCASSELRVVETISYAPDGSVIRTDSAPEPFESIPAGSFVALVQQAVC